MSSTPDVISIRREGDVTLTCGRCGLQRCLPRNWRELLRKEPTTPRDWDGVLRCQAGHLPEPMHCFEGMDKGEDGWRGRCACGAPGNWSMSKDDAWQQAADHLLAALEAVIRRQGC